MESESSRNLNLICDKFDAAWKSGAEPMLEEFLSGQSENRNELARLLVAIDIEYRLKNGLEVHETFYSKYGYEVQEVAGELLNRNRDLPTRIGVSSIVSEKEHQEQIGPYRLLEKIGEGGMGAVWLAEQHVPVRRQVAVKLIKSAWMSAEVVARFEAERQALALMDHPNIARIFDGGTTENGAPYFVMELVDGKSITEYCNSNKVNLEQRLSLFIEVCKAIQHAHQKGIIHRDLKPSNILVTSQDDKAVPKVIDFGLAKSTEHAQKLTDKSLHTQFGQVIGTLQYMSPEQAEMSKVDIDTRTDIYSLGVILYEMLVGSPPLSCGSIGEVDLLGLLQAIRENEPPLPSARLSSLGDSANSVSGNLNLSTSKFRQHLKGELDWVVMKALEKERSRRYETPNELAEEIARFLTNDPVLAKPPSASYRVQKFVRKHRVITTAVAAVLLAICIGTVASSWFAYKFYVSAEKERVAKEDAVEKEKLAVRELNNRKEMLNIITGSFQGIDPGQGGTKEMRAWDVLSQASKAVDSSQLERAPRAELFYTIASAYVGLGRFDDARDNAKRSLEECRIAFGPSHARTIGASATLAKIYGMRGELDKAVPILENARDWYVENFGDDHSETRGTLNALSNCYAGLGDLEKSVTILKQLLASVSGDEAEDSGRSISIKANLAISLAEMGKLEDATPYFEEVAKFYEHSLGKKHPKTLDAKFNLAHTYHDTGKKDLSLKMNQEVYDERKEILEPDHPDMIASITNLANGYYHAKQYDKGLKFFELAFERAKKRYGIEDPRTQGSLEFVITMLEDRIKRLEESGEIERSGVLAKKFAAFQKLRK